MVKLHNSGIEVHAWHMAMCSLQPKQTTAGVLKQFLNISCVEQLAALTAMSADEPASPSYQKVVAAELAVRKLLE